MCKKRESGTGGPLLLGTTFSLGSGAKVMRGSSILASVLFYVEVVFRQLWGGVVLGFLAGVTQKWPYQI